MLEVQLKELEEEEEGYWMNDYERQVKKIDLALLKSMMMTMMKN